MKVSLDWLKDYVEVTQTPEELAEMLTLLGAEVESVTDLGGDVCIELEINSNRPDLLGTIGIAREVAAATGQKLKLPPVGFPEEGEPIESETSVDVLDPELCPRYTARLIRGVTIKPSPPWMHRRLEAIGLRPINNVVDITNYVLMECGQPLHAFDFSLLEGGRIIVRRGRTGETITSIDETECKLTPERLVIADARRPVAVAGVMGGADSEVSNTTVDVLIESAVFDPVSIRRSSRALNLASDSSYRFERTVDPVGCEWASRRAISLIRELAGGTVSKGLIDVNTVDLSEPLVKMRLSRIPRVLGVEIPAAEVRRILDALEFGIVESGDDTLTVAIPPFRREVCREIDLIEEVARVWGYDRIPETSGMSIKVGTVSKVEAVSRFIHETLVRAGYDEVVTTSFVAPGCASDLTPWPRKGPVIIINPLRADESALRASVLPGLLHVKQHNQDRGLTDADIFEISRVQWLNADGKPVEIDTVGIMTDDGFRELKGVLEALLDRLCAAGIYTLTPRDNRLFVPGKAIAITIGGQTVGWLGELTETLRKYYDLKRLPCYAELDLSTLRGHAVLERHAAELPRFPSVQRDVAIVVDEAVTWEQITDCIDAASEPSRENVKFVDLYRGEQIGAGHKSIMFSVTYRHPDRTLTSEHWCDL